MKNRVITWLILVPLVLFSSTFIAASDKTAREISSAIKSQQNKIPETMCEDVVVNCMLREKPKTIIGSFSVPQKEKILANNLRRCLPNSMNNYSSADIKLFTEANSASCQEKFSSCKDNQCKAVLLNADELGRLIKIQVSWLI